jgi:hypothetical protein
MSAKCMFSHVCRFVYAYARGFVWVCVLRASTKVRNFCICTCIYTDIHTYLHKRTYIRICAHAHKFIYTILTKLHVYINFAGTTKQVASDSVPIQEPAPQLSSISSSSSSSISGESEREALMVSFTLPIMYTDVFICTLFIFIYAYECRYWYPCHWSTLNKHFVYFQVDLL